jgi:hypothetical protein
MKIISANGVKGCLLNPYHNKGKWTFRVYHDDIFTDYDLCHSDLFVTIDDADAYFYEDECGKAALDHSPETLGNKYE